MARSPRRRDFVDRSRQTRSDINSLRTAPGPENSKTWLVWGAINTSFSVLPLIAPSGWVIRGFDGELEAGQVTLNWELNGNVIYAGHVVPDDGEVSMAYPYLAVQRGDRLRPVVVADDGNADGLSATVHLTTTAV